MLVEFKCKNISIGISSNSTNLELRHAHDIRKIICIANIFVLQNFVKQNYFKSHWISRKSISFALIRRSSTNVSNSADLLCGRCRWILKTAVSLRVNLGALIQHQDLFRAPFHAVFY